MKLSKYTITLSDDTIQTKPLVFIAENFIEVAVEMEVLKIDASKIVGIKIEDHRTEVTKLRTSRDLLIEAQQFGAGTYKYN